MAKTHDLKIHPQYFKDVNLGIKKFELRLNDRNFKERDILNLREWNPATKSYTGKQVTKIVTDVYENLPGLLPNYVVLQLK